MFETNANFQKITRPRKYLFQKFILQYYEDENDFNLIKIILMLFYNSQIDRVC